MRKYVFGVDVGGTTVKIGLFTTDGELLENWEIDTRIEENGRFILPDIAESVKAKAKERGIPDEEIEGIGAGVPGPVNAEGLVVECANLGWGVTDAAKILSELTGWSVKIGNDANVAAMGERWQGSGKGFDNMVMVTLGTGVGGAMIVNGKVINGTHGSAGEIGHMTVFPTETEKCGCGKKGCLEQYASATGVVRLTRRYMAAHDTATPLRTTQPLTCRAVFEAAAGGDAVALEVLEEFGDILGRAIAWITCVMDPEVVVIGGGVSRSGSIVTDHVGKYYKKYAFHAAREVELRIASLGNKAGIYGGASLILE